MADQMKMHVHPAWRDKANFILIMKIDTDDPNDTTLRHEQIWTRQVDAEHFEVCCIPFFIYDLALGDIVRVVQQDDKHIVQGVVQASGRHTFRAWFQRPLDSEVRDSEVRDEVLAKIQERGYLIEPYSDDLAAIDAENDEMAADLAGFLVACEEAGILQYETGRTVEGHA